MASANQETTKPATTQPQGADPIFQCLERLRQDELNRQAPPKTRGVRGPIIKYTPVERGQLPRTCVDGNLADMRKAINIQVAACRKKSNSTQVIQLGCRAYTRDEWCLQTNLKLQELANRAKTFQEFVNNSRMVLDWYQNGGSPEDSPPNADGTPSKFKKGDMEFTGYYAPAAIEARSRPNGEFKYPIYKTPTNLVTLDARGSANCGRDPDNHMPVKKCLRQPDGTLKPMPTRRQIDQEGALAGQGLEIAYVKNPVDIAFLMVQGSGSLRIDGRPDITRVNYGDQNGRTRYMLGRVVRCYGGAKEDYSSMGGIRAFLGKQKSEILHELLAYDKSYIFYNAQSAEHGPYGVENIPITPRHSLATDRTITPTGAVALFNMPRSSNIPGSCRETTSMGIAQDTGGAIIGRKVDWYRGEGDGAAHEAGNLHQPGSLFMGVLPSTGTPMAECQ